jgi:acyl carrier protein
MALTRVDLIGFFEKNLRLEVDEIDDSTPIFSSGMADSFMLMNLLHFVEQQQGVRIGIADVTLDNFDSIERIFRFLQGLGEN